MRKSWKIQILGAATLAVAAAACGSKSGGLPIGGYPGQAVIVPPVVPVGPGYPGVGFPGVPAHDLRLDVTFETRVETYESSADIEAPIQALAHDGFTVTQISKVDRGQDSGKIVVLASRDKRRTQPFEARIVQVNARARRTELKGALEAAVRNLENDRFIVTAALTEAGEGGQSLTTLVAMKDTQDAVAVDLKVETASASSIRSRVRAWACDRIRVTAVASSDGIHFVLFGTRIRDDKRAYQVEIHTVDTWKIDECLDSYAMYGFVLSAVFRGEGSTWFVIKTRETNGDLGFDVIGGERAPEQAEAFASDWSSKGYMITGLTFSPKGEYRLIGQKARNYRGCPASGAAHGRVGYCGGFNGVSTGTANGSFVGGGSVSFGGSIGIGAGASVGAGVGGGAYGGAYGSAGSGGRQF